MAQKELLYRGILLVGSTLLALLAGEAGVRLYLAATDPAVGDLETRLESSRRASPERAFGRGNLMGLVQASADPEIVYELKPGLRGRFLGRPFAINSHGLRDRETSLDKPPGTVRIAGLGDSVMFGWGVAQAESYLEVLEDRLNEGSEGPDFEVLNFAVPGYNTAIEAAVFERKVLSFDPDLVVLHFVPNDLALPPFLQAPRRLGSLARSYLLELVRNRLRGLPLHEPRLRLRDAAPPAGGDPEQVPERYRHMVGEEGYRRAMARLAALARERSLPVIVIFLGGQGEPWNLVREVVEEEGLQLLNTGPTHSSYLAEHGIEQSPRGWQKTFWRSRRDHHPNALGHRLHAEALFEKLPGLIDGANAATRTPPRPTPGR